MYLLIRAIVLTKMTLIRIGFLTTFVNTSGKAGAQIPQLPLGDKSPPWGDNAECVYPYKVYTAECNKSLTATYQ
jgi:hypothetical protein